MRRIFLIEALIIGLPVEDQHAGFAVRERILLRQRDHEAAQTLLGRYRWEHERAEIEAATAQGVPDAAWSLYPGRTA